MKILVGKEAKHFFDNASHELGNKTPEDKQQYLNVNCSGYWTVKGNPNKILAFDNRNNNLWVEEFDEIKEALKYVLGIEAKTNNGTLI